MGHSKSVEDAAKDYFEAKAQYTEYLKTQANLFFLQPKFQPLIVVALVIVVIGILLILGELTVAGILMIVGGVALAVLTKVKFSGSRVSESQYEENLKEQAKLYDIKLIACSDYNIDESDMISDPIQFLGFEYDKATQFKDKLGGFYTDMCSQTELVFLKDKLVIYNRIFSTTEYAENVGKAEIEYSSIINIHIDMDNKFNYKDIDYSYNGLIINTFDKTYNFSVFNNDYSSASDKCDDAGKIIKQRSR